MNISEKQRILGLDAFRTIAIVGVTLFHMFPAAVPGGYFGVSMFFVLTGYLLAFTCERERLNEQFSLLNYYWKRFKRIYPSLTIVTLSTIGIYYFLAPKVIEAVRPEIISVLLGYNNWWQIFQHADYFARINNNSPFTHLWFMGIELQYYLCWPILFLIHDLFAELGLRKVSIVLIALLGIGLSTLMPIMYHNNVDITRLYYGTDTRVYALLFGAVIGLIHAGREIKSVDEGNSFAELLNFIVFGLCLGITLMSYKLLDGQNPLVYQGGMLAMTLIFCLMLIFMAKFKLGLGDYLEQPFFHWIGKHSYGIFLWQYPVIFLFNYLGWNVLMIAPLIEIAVILLLTMWSDSLSDSIRRRQLPSIGKRLIATQGMLFLTITLLGTIMMGFGCRSLAVSAKVKTDTVEFKNRIEANKVKIEKQNQQNKEELALKAQAEPVVQTNEPTRQKNRNVIKKSDLNGVVFIGDSIMLSAADEIQRYLPNCYINAKVARHMYSGIKVVKFFEAQGCLGKVVVIGLGTNEAMGYYEKYKEDVEEILEYLGPARQVYLINLYDGSGNYEWQRLANEYIKDLANERNNVSEIDWYTSVSQHPEWLWGDYIHPNVEGSKEYARIIYDTLTSSL